MSEETSFEEFGDETDYSLNVSASSNESDNTEANISLSEQESLEVDEISLRKESGDLFKNGTDIDKTTSESSSENMEADNNTPSLVKGIIEDVFEVEEIEDVAKNEFEPFKDTLTSAKSQQYGTEFVDTSTPSVEKETDVDLSYDVQSRAEVDGEHDQSVSAKSPKLLTAGVMADSRNQSPVTAAGDVFEDEVVEQDGTGTKSKSYSEAGQGDTASNKSPISPTGAMKTLSISESPNSKSKTPKLSRFRAKTVNIFDSPYNTRLKARMLREREMRSRSEGGSTDE